MKPPGCRGQLFRRGLFLWWCEKVDCAFGKRRYFRGAASFSTQPGSSRHQLSCIAGHSVSSAAGPRLTPNSRNYPEITPLVFPLMLAYNPPKLPKTEASGNLGQLSLGGGIHEGSLSISIV